jgi:hypothetical protein
MRNAHRQAALHGIIGLGVCIGGYTLLTAPAANRLAHARAEAARLTGEVARSGAIRDRVPAMTSELGAATRELATIDQRGRLARNERDLFAAITALGEREHVRIDQLAPSKSPPGAKQDAAAKPGDAGVRCSMTAVASYADLAAFLRAIRSELGYSVVRSVRVTPLPDDRASAVRATIETEHFAFALDGTPGATGPGGAP